MKPLYIQDLTIRDGQQSLWATRMTIGDMLPILPAMEDVGYWAIECWGGATFDTCMRFLDENPWERLRTIKKHCPTTPLAMLLRGQNLVGYKHYSKDIINHFVDASHRNGIDMFRVFDALNDIRNIVDCAEAINKTGAHFEGAISYTVSPVHTLDSYIEYALQLKELGADSICVKDMAGLLTPYRTERITKALKDATGLPIHLHCHYVGGMAPANFIKGAEAGAAIVDTCSAPLAFGNSHPSVEMMVSAFRESGFDTGLDLDLLFEIAEYFEEVRKRGGYKRGVSGILQMQVFSHQIPGGMMSNLLSQLEGQKALDSLDDVIKEIPRVRAEIGFPPLVTPMSQITGTQAVFNVLTGKRWSVVSQEMKDYLLGMYGKAPGPIDEEIRKKVLGDDVSNILPEDIAPGSLVTYSYEDAKRDIGDLAHNEEDVLMYALFPNEAKAYLSKHRPQEHIDFNPAEASSFTKEEDQVDMNQIRDLIRAVEESNIGEISIKEAGSEIVVRKPEVAQAHAQSQTVAVQPSASSSQETLPDTAQKSEEQGDRPDSWIPVKSPMVGTFYEAPSPDAGPYVEVGDEVMAGATLCIVEAMKLMNEITAEEMCVIREVCVEDAEPVEYGTVLFYVEPLSENEANPGEGE